MKKLLWTSAMALTAVACLTACDDSSSGASNSVPSYKTESALPDSCEMEVAKAGDTYFACFENEWVEVTDSATVEKIKEGLDEKELKEQLEELEEKLEEAAAAAKKPSSSSKKVASSADADEGDVTPESSASEEECTGRRCGTGNSSSSKKSSGGSGNGGSGSGDSGSGSGSGSSSDSGVGSSDSDEESSSSDKSSSSVKNSSSSVNNSSSSVSSSSLKRDAHFSPIDDYVTWDAEGKTATIENTGSGTTLMGALNNDGFTNEQVKSVMVGAYNEFLKLMGTDLSVSVDYLVSTKLVQTTKDSAMYILAIPNTKVGTVINTFVVPMGKCGDDSYYKLTQFCDGRGEGTVYKYVTIGTQTWMAENLNYTTASGSYCYDDKPDNCGTYGRLYTWATAVNKSESECGEYEDCNLGSGDIQGVCPNGWHLPTKTEWETLFTNVGGISTAGKALKISGDNTYGFSALFGGNRTRTGGFESLGTEVHFWTATQATSTVSAYSIYMKQSSDPVDVTDSWYKARSLSVRCVKN